MSDAARYPALTQLAQAYLHQDFWEDYGDPMGAVDDFLSRSDLAGQVADEVDRALAEFPSEEEARRFVQDDLDSMYLPDDDGISYRDWLRSVADRARAASPS
jgi:hypothetical protein